MRPHPDCCSKARPCAISILILLMNIVAVAQDEGVLHAFHLADGAAPQGALTSDSQQNLYGLTYAGGGGPCKYNNVIVGCGNVFQLSRTPDGWAERVLFAFQGGNDGAFPMAGLVLDGAGNLYGTTSQGGGLQNCGGYGCGIAFELVAPPNPGGTWTEKLLYSFTGLSDGEEPEGSLIFDSLGNLYSTAYGGGGGFGTVFELSPGANGLWTETTLYEFGGPPNGDGAAPAAGLVFDDAGNLYGTTVAGVISGNCCGTVFRLAPPPSPGRRWVETLVYAFTNESDGYFLYSTLIIVRGSLLGTTLQGGQYGFGTVFQLTQAPSGVEKTILYSFQDSGSDGAYPGSSLAVDPELNLYGTTVEGGCGGNCQGLGTVFQLTPPKSPAGAWSQKMLHAFSAGSDGALPMAGVLLDDGWLLGTTARGGGSRACNKFVGAANGCGTVFAVRK
jgi:uncharacterized repeat protein (TIGR03803 family)